MKAKRSKAGRRANVKSTVLRAVTDHPIRTAAIAAGAVAGVLLVRKAANTAANVVTMKAAGDAATKVAGAVKTARTPKRGPITRLLSKV